MSVNSLVSFQNKVESPFIKLTIGQYTFGHCEPFNRTKLRGMNVTFPNFLNGLSMCSAINDINLVLPTPVGPVRRIPSLFFLS